MAHFYSVYCKTDHEENGKIVEKISCFVVTKDMPGISFGEKEKKMGIKASETRAVYFDKVVVPASNMLGRPGQGFKIAMNVLNSGRLSLGSGSVGGMRTIIKLATAHAKGRKQFDRPISEFGLIQEKLAAMATLCYATESITYFTAGRMVQGMKDFSIESAICKVFGSESLWKVIDMGMQIAAGTGYMKEYPYEQIMRDSRINLIFEGTNEILRCFIALSGLKGPSDNLKELGKISDVSKALEDPIKSLGVLADFAKHRIGRMITSKGLNKGHAELQDYSTYFTAMLSDFSVEAENALMKHGKKIIDAELVQGRLANMAIELYVYVAVISRTTAILDNNSIPAEKKKHSLSLAKLALKDARHRFKSALKGMKGSGDRLVRDISKSVCENDGYDFDIINY
jgi:acyl-CoA dehydrogenase family protein 9